MEQYISPEVLNGVTSKQQQQQQQQMQQAQLQTVANLDFLSFGSTPDIFAPHPDLFESELDSSLADFDPLQLQSFIIGQPDAFNFLRSDTACGPPSTITVSSESASAYDTYSNYSESLVNVAASNYSFPLELDMDFSRASLGTRSEYASDTQNTAPVISADAISDYSYDQNRHSPSSQSSLGELEQQQVLRGTSHRHTSSVYSGYGSGSDYYPPIGSNHPSLGYVANVIAPTATSPHQQQPTQVHVPQRSISPVGAGLGVSLLPRLTRNDGRSPQRLSSSSHSSHTLNGVRNEHDDNINDPRKKYPCPQCKRAFARAFNLKTHLGTHDPQRPKPFVCHHNKCGRSFSRKHDLGRHLVSIHRDSSEITSTGDNTSDDGQSSPEPRIGVSGMKDGMVRCDTCGKSGPKKCTCSIAVK